MRGREALKHRAKLHNHHGVYIPAPYHRRPVDSRQGRRGWRQYVARHKVAACVSCVLDGIRRRVGRLCVAETWQTPALPIFCGSPHRRQSAGDDEHDDRRSQRCDPAERPFRHAGRDRNQCSGAEAVRARARADGDMLATLNSGAAPFSLTLISQISAAPRRSRSASTSTPASWG